MSKRAAAVAVVMGLTMAMGACTSTDGGGSTSKDQGTTATLASGAPFYSFNVDTTYGNTAANADVLYLTNDTFTYYDDEMNLVPNESFGTYTKDSDDPLTVTQTLADTAVWSDGVPVTPADLVLQWGATSGNFNTRDQADIAVDKETGAVTSTNEGTDVYFDAHDPARALVTEFPQIDGPSVTYTYSQPFVDWQQNLWFGAGSPGLPAHIVGKRALGIDDATQAADAVVAAFRDHDADALAKISNVWNRDYNVTTTPDAELSVGTGPYTVSELTDTSLTVQRNENYAGDHAPSIDAVVLRFIPDGASSVQALANGDVLVSQPQATAVLLTTMQGLEGVTVLNTPGAVFEHLDLAENNAGPFDAATYDGDAGKARLVRQAFLHTVPRQEIVDTLVVPLNPDAEVRNSFTVVPGAPGYDDMVSANGMQKTYGAGPDLAQAEEVLTKAGLTPPVTVRVMYADGDALRAQEFQALKASAEADGLFVVENVARSDWNSTLSDTAVYDAALFGWETTSTAVGESRASYGTGLSNNFYGYTNAEVDDLYATLEKESDAAKQQEILRKIESLLVADGFGLTLFQHPRPTGVSDRLGNVSTMPLGPAYLWNFWEWTLD